MRLTYFVALLRVFIVFVSQKAYSRSIKILADFYEPVFGSQDVECRSGLIGFGKLIRYAPYHGASQKTAGPIGQVRNLFIKDWDANHYPILNLVSRKDRRPSNPARWDVELQPIFAGTPFGLAYDICGLVPSFKDYRRHYGNFLSDALANVSYQKLQAQIFSFERPWGWWASA
jgi:hypothetical protein